MENNEGRRGIPSLLSPSNEEHIASDITELVGWTPLVEMKKITAKDGLNVRLIGKLEFYQPLSSVKDRAALRMIQDAEQKGLITPGVTTLVEPTSGNLGIGITLTAIQKGYRFIAVMPAQYSLDKQIILRYLRAEVVLTDPLKGFDGMLEKTEELKKEIPHVHVLDQFNNPSNVEAHFEWTGPEIWKDTGGKIDIFVAGTGSGGTISGVGKYLKMKNPDIKIVCVEPTESPLISGGEPGPHKIQGIGPPVIPKVFDRSVVDRIVTVNSDEAMVNARRLAQEEGILVGISAGAALAASLKLSEGKQEPKKSRLIVQRQNVQLYKVHGLTMRLSLLEEGILVGISAGAALAASLKLAAEEENKGKMIVMIFPSGGERYTNSDLFAEVREECVNMTF